MRVAANMRPSTTPTICAVRLSLIAADIIRLASSLGGSHDRIFALLVKHSDTDCMREGHCASTLADCAPGIAETHVVGSEQFVCVLCGHVTRTDSDGAERFSFTFDKVRKE